MIRQPFVEKRALTLRGKFELAETEKGETVEEQSQGHAHNVLRYQG
jgi:hypothetical protein